MTFKNICLFKTSTSSQQINRLFFSNILPYYMQKERVRQYITSYTAAHSYILNLFDQNKTRQSLYGTTTSWTRSLWLNHLTRWCFSLRLETRKNHTQIVLDFVVVSLAFVIAFGDHLDFGKRPNQQEDVLEEVSWLSLSFAFSPYFTLSLSLSPLFGRDIYHALTAWQSVVKLRFFPVSRSSFFFLSLSLSLSLHI